MSSTSTTPPPRRSRGASSTRCAATTKPPTPTCIAARIGFRTPPPQRSRRRGRPSPSASNARSSKEVVWTRGTTEAINLVAASLRAAGARRRRRGAHHLHWSTTPNIVPWQLACSRFGARLRAVRGVAERRTGLGGLRRQARFERTKIVAFGHVSNALGTDERRRRAWRRVAEGGRARRRWWSTAPKPCPTLDVGRAGSRLRLLRFLRSQDVRANRHRRAGGAGKRTARRRCRRGRPAAR